MEQAQIVGLVKRLSQEMKLPPQGVVLTKASEPRLHR
jgi:hypothetical protein